MRAARACAAIATILGGIVLPATPLTAEPQPPGVRAFVRDRHLARYTVALADLDGDRRPEALVYAMATTRGGGTADLCGSGGCPLYVLALGPKHFGPKHFGTGGYRKVTTVSVARPPVRVLEQTTQGWHDLSVLVAGGGIVPGYEARLRFDGTSYPTNPTMPPAMPLKGARGRVVIDVDAALLRSGAR